LPSTAPSAVENTPFTITFVAHALGDDPSNDVSALASLPTNLTLQSATADGGTCSNDGGSVTCTLGTLQPQEKRNINLMVTGTATGNSTATLSVTSSNDSAAGNNSSQLAVQISAAAPPSSTTSSSSASSGGGGGGGNLDVLILAILSGTAAWRLTRNRSSS
jgi:hypothetical protein